MAAFRSEEVGGEHPLRRISPTAAVELQPLEVHDIHALAESMAGPLPKEALDVVVQLSQGSPFMAQAVLRGLVETGALVEEASGWRADPVTLADATASRRASTPTSSRTRAARSSPPSWGRSRPTP